MVKYIIKLYPDDSFIAGKLVENSDFNIDKDNHYLIKIIFNTRYSKPKKGYFFIFKEEGEIKIFNNYKDFMDYVKVIMI